MHARILDVFQHFDCWTLQFSKYSIMNLLPFSVICHSSWKCKTIFLIKHVFMPLPCFQNLGCCNPQCLQIQLLRKDKLMRLSLNLFSDLNSMMRRASEFCPPKIQLWVSRQRFFDMIECLQLMRTDWFSDLMFVYYLLLLNPFKVYACYIKWINDRMIEHYKIILTASNTSSNSFWFAAVLDSSFIL